MAYRPFGEPLAETGTPVGRQRYTGREADGNGCYYYRARYYCPGLGIFLSEDPLKFKAGPNFYAYVGNNPVNANDPSGLDAYTLGGTINILGVGLSLGGFISFPGPKNNDNFDIGVYASIPAPGLPWSSMIRNTVNPDYPDLPLAANVGMLTIDVGYEWDGRSALSGVNTSFEAGAGLWGGTLNQQSPTTDAIPVSGFQVNFGPQIRLGTEVSIGGAYSIGDFFQDVIFPAADAVRDMFSPTVPRAVGPSSISGYDLSSTSFRAAGGFVLYPNKPNSNQMKSVYQK